MIAPRIASLAVALVFTASVSLFAQESVEAEPFPPLTPDKVVLVHMRGGLRLQGPLLSMTPDTLILLSGAVPIASVDSLWVRGNAAGTGAIVGAVVVGAPSFAFWALFCNAMSETDGCEAWGTVTLFSLAGAAGGALLGGAIGYATKKWRLWYARPLRVGLVRQRDSRLGLAVSVSVAF